MDNIIGSAATCHRAVTIVVNFVAHRAVAIVRCHRDEGNNAIATMAKSVLSVVVVTRHAVAIIQQQQGACNNTIATRALSHVRRAIAIMVEVVILCAVTVDV
jgi:hypothetical protein